MEHVKGARVCRACAGTFSQTAGRQGRGPCQSDGVGTCFATASLHDRWKQEVLKADRVLERGLEAGDDLRLLQRCLRTFTRRAVVGLAEMLRIIWEQAQHQLFGRAGLQLVGTVDACIMALLMCRKGHARAEPTSRVKTTLLCWTLPTCSGF